MIMYNNYTHICIFLHITFVLLFRVHHKYRTVIVKIKWYMPMYQQLWVSKWMYLVCVYTRLLLLQLLIQFLLRKLYLFVYIYSRQLILIEVYTGLYMSMEATCLHIYFQNIKIFTFGSTVTQGLSEFLWALHITLFISLSLAFLLLYNICCSHSYISSYPHNT